jgi:hypothetical protein
LPIIGIYFRTNSPYDIGKDTFSITNIGNGVAFNIEIKDWFLVITDTNSVWKFEMTVPGTIELMRN